MTRKEKKIQIVLVITGFLLIIGTYLIYPNIKKIDETDNLVEENNLLESNLEKSENNEATFFQNVEYKGLYDFDKPFTINSNEAYILKDEADIVYMTNMLVVLYLKDGRTVNIQSDEGRYNKENYDVFFEKNVKASDGAVKIYAKNLDLLATKSTAEVYNDVEVIYPEGSLFADKVDYDFQTKYFRVSMFDENDVKVKIIK